MKTTIVKTREAHDFLALVPQLVGFQPERSVVLVAFRGNRTCGAMRFNLPEPELSCSLLRRVATSLIGTLCKIDGVDAVVPVVYTDESFEAAGSIPGEPFADVLVRRAELSGFLVRDALCVAADGWGSYLDARCPAAGRPLSAIAESEVTGAIPGDARRELATLASRADLPRVDTGVRERFARRYARYENLGGPAEGSAELLEMVGDILDPVATAEAALDLTLDLDIDRDRDLDSAPVSPPLEVAAELLFLVQSPARRDQIMLQIAFGEAVGRATHELNLRYAAIQSETGRSMDDIVAAERERGETDSSLLRTGDLLLGLVRDRPDPERILRGLRLLKTVVALAPRRARPAPLCILAWWSWALGRGSVAGIFVEHALAIDPDYGMAVLLSAVVGSGHLPDWAFAVPEG